jgi:hydrogenase maturation protease
MGDEGIGVEVVRRLEKDYGPAGKVEFLDGGTGGVTLIHAMSNRRKGVFIDCARMSGPPGTIRRFEMKDVESVKSLPEMSLHEADLIEILQLADQLGKSPDRVVVYGIEPESVEPGQGLSGELESRLPAYARKIAEEFTTKLRGADSD